MDTSKDRKIRATIEFEIVVPGHEPDDRKFIERCFVGTRIKVIDVKKAEEVKA